MFNIFLTVFSRSIRPDQEITEKVKVKPKTVGRREIIAVFHSKQLQGIDGAVSVKVVPAVSKLRDNPRQSQGKDL